MRLPFPLVIINIQEEEKISYLITLRYATQISLRTEGLITWMSPSSFLWGCKDFSFTQGHILSLLDSRQGPLTHGGTAKQCHPSTKNPHVPMKLLLHPHHSPAPPYPVLCPHSFTVWFPRSHHKSPWRLYFLRNSKYSMPLSLHFLKG